MSLPIWLEKFHRFRNGGGRGFIFTGNTCDLVFVDDQQLPPPCQLKFFLAQLLQTEGYEVYLFSLATGLQTLNSGRNLNVLQNIANPRDIEEVLTAFTVALRKRVPKIALIIDYADHLAPHSQGLNAVLAPQHLLALQTFHSWGNDDTIRSTDNLIILLSHENQINDLLTKIGSGYFVITIELPNEEVRYAFANLLLDLRDRGRDFGALADGFNLNDFARLTSGLRLRDIEGLFREAGATKEEINRNKIKGIKSEVIRQLAGGLLEVVDTDYGMEAIGGSQHIKNYISTLKWRWLNGATDIPQAMLLAGVPGCGKSFSVKAIAKELSLPLLVMRNIREQWVGASERNLEFVLQILETLAPALVWIDELDQALGQRTTGQSADAGTSERMLARIWEFMGAMRHRGRILWVATTNRPDLLDAATLDRFPVVIPLIHPSPGEIGELLPLLCKQLNRELASDVRFSEVVSLPSLRLPTIRGLQEIIAKAGEFADIETNRIGSPIYHRHILSAANLYKPNYNPLLHSFIALTALRMTSFQDLLPWYNNPNYEFPPYLEGLVNDQGELDIYKLNERINQLQQQLQWERFARQF
jgi:hypothetical protein